MSSLKENEVINELLQNITDKKGSELKNQNQKLKKKDNISEKNCCIAAVRYNTIGNAYKDVEKQIPVYLVKEDKNGVIKTDAYARCSKTTRDGEDFCHLHCRMTKYNKDGLKIFEKDILPKSENDKTRILANISDDFFENMGKRGAKKKNGENNFIFPSDNHPVLLIMSHKNAKLATQLSLYATELLKNSNIAMPDEKNKFLSGSLNDNKKKNNESIKEKTYDIMDLISSIKKDNSTNVKKLSDNEESDNESECSSESEEIQNNKSTNISSDKHENEESEDDPQDYEESEDEGSSDDQEDDDQSNGVECEKIITNKGKTLWLNIENNIVYEPEGDDGGEEIGVLTKIPDKHHTILYKDVKYTVIKTFNDIDKGQINCCVLSNKLFDKKFKLIGKRMKLKNNEYKFDYTL
jgi:hypothetical protein